MQEREESFDRVTQMGATLFETPMCLISFVDEDEQWFKSAVGLESSSTGRDAAFCTYTVLRDMPGPFVVLDARNDIRFAKNPLVTGPPFIQFYAGAPIYHPDSQHKMGSFCVLDTKPWPVFTDKNRQVRPRRAAAPAHRRRCRAAPTRADRALRLGRRAARRRFCKCSRTRCSMSSFRARRASRTRTWRAC